MRSGRKHYKLVPIVLVAIEPGLASNPENVKRVRRVFPQSEWDFLTQMAAPEYTYTRFLRAIGKFQPSVESTPMVATLMLSVRNPSSPLLLTSHETGGHIAIDNTSDNPLTLEEWQQANCMFVKWVGRRSKKVTSCGQTIGRMHVGLVRQSRGYFGRGAKQLSYALTMVRSQVMFDGDATVLLNNQAWLLIHGWTWLLPFGSSAHLKHLNLHCCMWLTALGHPLSARLDAGIGYGFGTTINAWLMVWYRVWWAGGNKDKANQLTVFVTGKG